MIIRLLISAVFLLIAGLHLFVPAVTLDTTAIVLVVIALIPWLAPLLKSMELPGGFKFEFKDLVEVGRRVTDAGLVSASLSESDEQQYSFQLVASDDPVLALAGLRIEIEKRLRHLAEQHQIGTRMEGIGNMIRNLRNQGLLEAEEHSVIADMIAILNKAVHAEDVDPRAADWAINFGPRILKALDERIGE